MRMNLLAACTRNGRIPVLATCLSMALVAGANAQQGAAVELDIEAQELAPALRQLGRQAGIEIGFLPEAVASKRARAVKGPLPPDEAIKILLADSGMTARRTPEGALVVEQFVATRFAAPQSAPAASVSSSSSPGSDETADLDEVSVTGSRIQRSSGMTTPTPLTSVGIGELAALAPGPLMDALEQMPQFLNSATVNNTGVGGGAFGTAGQSILNLRGVGSNRTLVLLDGRRISPSSRFSTVDISTFPEALVERVEVVTGGASAAYGSDAVSGVVNFILDTDYTGFKGEMQKGITAQSDNESLGGSLSWGGALGSRAHLVASAEYYEADAVTNYYDRDWFQSWGVINNPTFPGSGPQRVTVPNVRSRVATYGGLITGGPLRGIQFLEGGVPAQFQDGAYITNNSQQGGGVGALDNGYDYWMMPEQKRGSAFTHMTYDLNEDTSLYAQVLYGRNFTKGAKFQSALVPPYAATIYRENAFLPASVRQRMIDANVQSFPFGRIGSPRDLSAGIASMNSTLLSYTGGVDGKLAGGWTYDAYYQFGQTKRRVNFGNGTIIRTDRLYRAIDAVVNPATGAIVCRSTLLIPNDGCVPINLFGDGSPSREAKAYVWEGETYEDQTLKQHAAEFTVQGEAFDNWVGPVGVAAGAAYRKDSLSQIPGPADLVALSTPPSASLGYRGLPSNMVGDNIWDQGNPDLVVGDYDVWELFTETIVPVLADVPLVKSLDVSAAARYASYSRTGGVWAWKGGIDWQVVTDLRLRATRSRDSRAGSLSERFDSSGGGGSVTDPFRPGEDPIIATVVTGGNPDIGPEEADTLTYGFVYQPSWLPGFALSTDYYDIKINGAIAQLTAQVLVDQCFNGAQQLCGQITRSTDGRIDTINSVFLNIAEARTKGIDIEASYSRPITLFGGGETLGLRGFATHITEASTTNFGATKVDRAGQTGSGTGAPDWQATASVNYRRGPLNVSVQERYISSGTYNSLYVEGIDIDDNSVAGALYTHLRMTYELDLGGGNFEVFGHVSNLFDKAPALAPSFSTFGGTAHTNPAYFDELGRRYSVGVKFNY